MNDLTSSEIKVLNNLTKVLNPDVFLGNKLQTIIDNMPIIGTPVNAVKANGLLTLTGVVIHREKVSIGNDVYEFLADVGQIKSAETNIAVNIVSNTVRATKNLTVDTKPTSGDTMTIDGVVYTFVPVGTDTAGLEISIGADLAAAQANIVAAINGTDEFNSPHPSVVAGNFADNVSAITALVGGTVGNSIGITETFTAESNIFAGATLSGGANCSAANAITKLIAAITASDTEGVGATPGSGTTVVLTADIGGSSGNSISISCAMANGSVGHATLTEGVNGTVAPSGSIMVDSSYLYIATAANNSSGDNWRRISVGSVF